MIIVEILIFYIRKLGEKILQKKKTNLSACKAHHRYRLNKNIVIIVGLISTVTNKILHHFINKAFFFNLWEGQVNFSFNTSYRDS